MEPCTFQPMLKKIKTTPSEFLYSNIKKFPKFSQEKTVLIFQGMESQKKIVIFEEELSKTQKPKFFIFLQKMFSKFFSKSTLG